MSDAVSFAKRQMAWFGKDKEIIWLRSSDIIAVVVEEAIR